MAGDWVFVGLLFANPLLGFLLHGLEIRAAGFPPSERWQWEPGSWLTPCAPSGSAPEAASPVWHVAYWIHIAIGLSFVAYIPFSKAMHMFTSGVRSRRYRSGFDPPAPRTAAGV